MRSMVRFICLVMVIAGLVSIACADTYSDKLDRAFDEDRLILEEVELPGITSEEFNVPEALLKNLEALELKDADLLSDELLFNTVLLDEFFFDKIIGPIIPYLELISTSPGGNSRIYITQPQPFFSYSGGDIICYYNGKYRIVFPSLTRSVPDTIDNTLEYIHKYYIDRVFPYIGRDGVIYSADGRYAGIYNVDNSIYAAKYIDPVIIDLSTGEMILTAKYGKKFGKENSGAIIAAVFSSDGRYFYYILGGTPMGYVLSRYDLFSGETELCCSLPFTPNWPLYETQDGSFIIDYQVRETSDSGILKINFVNDSWVIENKEFSKDIVFNRLLYSRNSDNAFISGYIAFLYVKPGDDYSGLSDYYLIDEAAGTVIKTTYDEYIETVTLKAQQLDFSPYAFTGKALLSPDGRYAMLWTYKPNFNMSFMTPTKEDNHLYLIKLATMELREIKGFDPVQIPTDPDTQKKYRPLIEWNSETLIILTENGIKTYQFDFE